MSGARFGFKSRDRKSVAAVFIPSRDAGATLIGCIAQWTPARLDRDQLPRRCHSLKVFRVIRNRHAFPRDSPSSPERFTFSYVRQIRWWPPGSQEYLEITMA